MRAVAGEMTSAYGSHLTQDRPLVRCQKRLFNSEMKETRADQDGKYVLQFSRFSWKPRELRARCLVTCHTGLSHVIQASSTPLTKKTRFIRAVAL